MSSLSGQPVGIRAAVSRSVGLANVSRRTQPRWSFAFGVIVLLPDLGQAI
jgi:hypothetical protein